MQHMFSKHPLLHLSEILIYWPRDVFLWNAGGICSFQKCVDTVIAVGESLLTSLPCKMQYLTLAR